MRVSGKDLNVCGFMSFSLGVFGLKMSGNPKSQTLIPQLNSNHFMQKQSSLQKITSDQIAYHAASILSAARLGHDNAGDILVVLLPWFIINT